MASAEWIHCEGTSDRREGWRHLQNVLHEFHDGQGSFLWRKVPRTDSARTDSLHRQIRRSESAERNADNDNFEEGLLRNGTKRGAGRCACCYSNRSVLRRLAGIAGSAGEPGRARDSRLKQGPFHHSMTVLAQVSPPPNTTIKT